MVVGNDQNGLKRPHTVVEYMKLSRRIDRSVKRVHFDGLDQFLAAQHRNAKSFWIGILMFSTTCIIFEIFKLYYNYRQTPIVTEMSMQQLKAGEAELPDVEICFPVTASQKWLDAHGLKPETAMIISRILTAGSFVEIQRILSPLNYHEHWASSGFSEQQIELFAKEYKFSYRQLMTIQKATKGNFDFDDGSKLYETFMRMGFDVDDVFLECAFRGFHIRRLSCKELVQEVLNPNFGKCFLIASSRYGQELSGEGLTLLIDAQVSDYPRSKLLMPKVAGISVNFHRKHHYDPYSYSHVDMAPGMFTKVSIDLEHHEYINVKRGSLKQHCCPDDDVDFQILAINFSAQACIVDCCQQLVEDLCQCYLAEDRKLLKSHLRDAGRFCSLHDIHGCVMHRLEQNSTAAAVLRRCAEKCHKACSFWKYNLQIDTMPLHRSWLDYCTARNISPEYLIHLDVAYGELQYKAIKQQWSADVHSLISDIGGQVGLWNGSCMVTLIHISTVICIAFGNYMVKLTRSFVKCCSSA